MKYLGDFAEDATIRFGFNTRTAAGAPVTLGGTPAVSIYIDGGTTEITAGVTLTVDFDSRTGYHVVEIDASADAAYVAAADYRVVITTGTVDSVSVVGVEVGSFSIENRAIDAAVIQGAAGAAMDAAITTYGLDHLVSASVAGVDVADNSILAKLVSKSATADWDDFVNTSDSLQAMRDQLATAAVTDSIFTNMATAAALTTVGNNVTAIVSYLDTEITAILNILNNLNTALESDGATGYQFTALALENAPGNAEAIRIEMDTNSTKLASIVEDTDELQTDLVNGGRLDLIIDALTTELAKVKKIGEKVRHTLNATTGSGTAGDYDETTETRV